MYHADVSQGIDRSNVYLLAVSKDLFKVKIGELCKYYMMKCVLSFTEPHNMFSVLTSQPHNFNESHRPLYFVRALQ